MEKELKHFSHDQHSLVLKAHKMDNTLEKITCEMCSTLILGPLYGCEECGYYLHKVCAELPKQIMNHPMHTSEHGPLTLGADSSCSRDTEHCHICNGERKQFVYKCSVCKFSIDMLCLSVSQMIQDKCHSHPLIPLQVPASFFCFICHTEEIGFSYKCSICPFWVHQNCTLIPSTVKHNDHDHHLTLMNLIPNEYRNLTPLNCNICYGTMSKLETFYYCAGCMFLTHVRCATSDVQSSSDENIEVRDDLPVCWDSISLISSLVRNLNRSENVMDNEFKHFAHCHSLYLLDDQSNEHIHGKVCEACSQPLTHPSYGCKECDYFLHKCCTELPREITHPFHPYDKLELFAQFPHDYIGFFVCSCCAQLCNSYGYKSRKCGFVLDVKCGSLLGPIKHKAHKHPLTPILSKPNTCHACDNRKCPYTLECNTCNFRICPKCVMLPPFTNHRFCRCYKQGLTLFVSPIEKYDKDYGCDICEKPFHPKYWFYHCIDCQHFSHSLCLIVNVGGSNIKYGKRYNLPVHEHMLTLTPFTRESSPCSYCRASLYRDIAVGFRCSEANCKFKVHMECAWKIILSRSSME